MLWRVESAALRELALEERQMGEICHHHHQIFLDEAYCIIERVSVKIECTWMFRWKISLLNNMERKVRSLAT
jgi:hypothetical protein